MVTRASGFHLGSAICAYFAELLRFFAAQEGSLQWCCQVSCALSKCWHLGLTWLFLSERSRGAASEFQ